MIPNTPLSHHITISHSTQQHIKIRNPKLLSKLTVLHNSVPSIKRKNIKLLRSLELHQPSSTPKALESLCNTSDHLCKKVKTIQNLKLNYIAVTEKCQNLNFFGFGHLKSLKTLDLDLMLLPERSTKVSNWIKPYTLLVNNSKKLTSFKLTYNHCYASPEELAIASSKTIRLAKLESFHVYIDNPPFSGNLFVCEVSSLLRKMNALKNLKVEGGYSGLKVDASTYFTMLQAVSHLPKIAKLELDLDIYNQKEAGLLLDDVKFFKELRSLKLNVHLKENTLSYLFGLFSKAGHVKDLDLVFYKRHKANPLTSIEWGRIFNGVLALKDLEKLNIMCQFNSGGQSEEDKGALMRLVRGYRKLGQVFGCSRREASEEEEDRAVRTIFEFMSSSGNDLRQFGIKFSNRTYSNLSSQRRVSERSRIYN